ncbi:MAG: LacI family DNA-binding transcriptional regulator [Clostridia bacterium]|nr:LacI family DNA-binding transcriptional regulator [Clostridia bacterium]
MTLSKLAKLANVSVSVVSKAFSGRDDISEHMREHVFEVAKKHGCFQQFYHARYDKPVIAVIIPEAISKYYIRYIQKLKEEIELNGYTMLLSISNFDPELIKELTNYYVVHSKVDGLIVIDENFSPSFNPADFKTAIVTISSNKYSFSGTHIVKSNVNGIHDAISYLYENGHKNIGFIGEFLTENKQKAIEKELSNFNLNIIKDWFFSSSLRFEEAGKKGIETIYSKKGEKPTAIIGAYGYITQGILSKLKELNISVPNDVSVISLNNEPSPISSEMDVSFVSSNIDNLCTMAIEILNEKMGVDNPNNTANIIDVDYSFYMGNTISKAKK